MCQGCTDVARRRNKLPQNKASQRRSDLKRRYGITPEQYGEMVVSQRGRCAICQIQADLQIDHDHSTGAIRGLLCHKCNKVLGLMSDSSERLESALAYLERNAKETVSSALVKIGQDFGFAP
jgi:hypothetical protein